MRSTMLVTMLIVGFALSGVTASSAIPANGAAIPSADQSENVIQVRNGCGHHYHYAWRLGRCAHN